MNEKERVAELNPGNKKKDKSSGLRKADFEKLSGSLVDHVLILQGTIGNQTVERLLRSGTLQAKLHIEHQSVSGDTYLQRDEDRTLPSVPEFRLTTPSLLEPNVPAYSNIQLQVPQLTFTRINELLDPAFVRQALFRIDPGSIQLSSATATPAPQANVPGSGPLVPAGAGPSPPRPASGMDIIKGLMEVPAIHSALKSIQDQANDRVSREFGRLKRGEQITAITAGAMVGSGSLALILLNPDSRQTAFSLLNGRTFPVPGISGLRFELNNQGEDWMVGFHLDVNALLGFGPSSRPPESIGGPPTRGR